MKSVFQVLGIFFFLCFQGYTQDTTIQKITFDRPGIADSPYLVPVNSFQVESGFTYNNEFGISEAWLPAMLVRIPFVEKSEIRLTLNYEPQSLKFINDNYSKGYDPVAIGFKKHLVNHGKNFPEMALSANVFYPLQFPGNGIEKNEICFDSYLLFQNNINHKHALNYNVGYVYANSRNKNMLAWSFCYNFAHIETLTLFAEYFGYYHFTGNETETGIDGGIIWQFHDHLQADISYVYNFFQNDRAGFLLMGFSFNIPVKG